MKYHCWKRIVVFCVLMCLMLSLAACGKSAAGDDEAADAKVVSAVSSDSAGADDNETYELQTRELFAMDTYMALSAYGAEAEAALDEAEAEIMRLDRLLAAEAEDSEIYALNQNGGGQLSADTEYLIERSLELHDETDGAFEIAVYPLKQAWGFADQSYRVPDDDTIRSLLPLADSSLLRLDQEAGTVSYAEEGVQIDLGGIAKGYTSSRIIDSFMKYDVKGMVNLGGNVQCWGSKPDGTDWRVAVRAPESEDGTELPWLTKAASGSSVLAGVEYIGILETHDQAVITSGGYERYFEEDGQVYHHIIDPKTGYPSDADLISVTIVSEDGTMADGLSTSMFVLGLDRASKIWRAHSDEFDMILMDTEGNLFATEGIEGQFSSDLEINWIRR